MQYIINYNDVKEAYIEANNSQKNIDVFTLVIKVIFYLCLIGASLFLISDGQIYIVGYTLLIYVFFGGIVDALVSIFHGIVMFIPNLIFGWYRDRYLDKKELINKPNAISTMLVIFGVVGFAVAEYLYFINAISKNSNIKDLLIIYFFVGVFVSKLFGVASAVYNDIFNNEDDEKKKFDQETNLLNCAVAILILMVFYSTSFLVVLCNLFLEDADRGASGLIGFCGVLIILTFAIFYSGSIRNRLHAYRLSRELE